jgi:hypothetical protein
VACAATGVESAPRVTVRLVEVGPVHTVARMISLAAALPGVAEESDQRVRLPERQRRYAGVERGNGPHLARARGRRRRAGRARGDDGLDVDLNIRHSLVPLSWSG